MWRARRRAWRNWRHSGCAWPSTTSGPATPAWPLSHLPVNELKIDRSFVQHATGAGADATMVAPTIGLGHSLGLSIVTEGVEDAQTWALLRRLGADVARGYYVSRPLPAPDLEDGISHAALHTRRASA